MTAFHSIILLSVGAPLTPTGGSSCNLLKSLMSLRLAGVDMFYVIFFFIFSDLNATTTTATTAHSILLYPMKMLEFV